MEEEEEEECQALWHKFKVTTAKENNFLSPEFKSTWAMEQDPISLFFFF